MEENVVSDGGMSSDILAYLLGGPGRMDGGLLSWLVSRRHTRISRQRRTLGTWWMGVEASIKVYFGGGSSVGFFFSTGLIAFDWWRWTRVLPINVLMARRLKCFSVLCICGYNGPLPILEDILLICLLGHQCSGAIKPLSLSSSSSSSSSFPFHALPTVFIARHLLLRKRKGRIRSIFPTGNRLFLDASAASPRLASPRSASPPDHIAETLWPILQTR